MKPVVGIVVSNKMQKSVVVAVDRLFHNKVYNRYVKRTSKFMAHDEADECNIGDRVSSPRAIDPSQPPPSVPILSSCSIQPVLSILGSIHTRDGISMVGFVLPSSPIDHAK
jgi:hypothetical protein